jgi:hypothetical protein
VRLRQETFINPALAEDRFPMTARSALYLFTKLPACAMSMVRAFAAAHD